MATPRIHLLARIRAHPHPSHSRLTRLADFNHAGAASTSALGAARKDKDLCGVGAAVAKPAVEDAPGVGGEGEDADDDDADPVSAKGEAVGENALHDFDAEEDLEPLALGDGVEEEVGGAEDVLFVELGVRVGVVGDDGDEEPEAGGGGDDGEGAEEEGDEGADVVGLGLEFEVLYEEHGED